MAKRIATAYLVLAASALLVVLAMISFKTLITALALILIALSVLYAVYLVDTR